jgi:hypothetical protein
MFDWGLTARYFHITAMEPIDRKRGDVLVDLGLDGEAREGLQQKRGRRLLTNKPSRLTREPLFDSV